MKNDVGIAKKILKHNMNTYQHTHTHTHTHTYIYIQYIYFYIFIPKQRNITENEREKNLNGEKSGRSQVEFKEHGGIRAIRDGYIKAGVARDTMARGWVN